MVDYAVSQTERINVTESSRILAGVTISATAWEAVSIRAAVTLDVFGTVAGPEGIRSEVGGAGVAIHATGSVAGGMRVSGGTVTNFGSVSNRTPSPFFTSSAITAQVVNNYGTAVGAAGASGVDMVNAGTLVGLRFYGASATTLTNAGTITGVTGADAGVLRNHATVTGSDLGASVTHALHNTGTISGGNTGVRFDSSYSDQSLRNVGLITATAADGTALDVRSMWRPTTVDNEGRIVAQGTAVHGDEGSQLVNNRGSIVGSVALGGGDDVFDTVAGHVAGAVALGDGADTLLGSAGTDAVSGDAGDDVLRGNGGDDVLDGGDGADLLDGGTGIDRLTGGAGDDRYHVDSARDRVIEGTGGGFDTVYTAAAFTLRSGAEVEALTADPNADMLGLSLTGNGFVQTITGDNGANRITGGGGADTLIGLAGDDVYVVDDGATLVTEAAGGGVDTVLTGVSFTLPDHVEVLRASGTGAVDLTGNALDNRILGNEGANVLNGGAGADTMVGDLGDDVYHVDHSGDVVKDTGGRDTVHSMVDYTLGKTVETLILAGTGDLAGTGNTQANTIVGNDGANVLSGRGGLDVLTGGAGADTFLFETKASAGSLATITDFTAGEDRLALDAAAFRRIGDAGSLNHNFFNAGPATTRDHHLLYDQATGTLFTMPTAAAPPMPRSPLRKSCRARC